MSRSLSDLGGYDAVGIHGGTPAGALRAVHTTFRSATRDVTLDDLRALHKVLRAFAKPVAKEYGTLFTASAFEALVFAGQEAADARFND